MILDLYSPIATIARKWNQLFLLHSTCISGSSLLPDDPLQGIYYTFLSANGSWNLTDGPGNLISLEGNGILMTHPL